MRSALKSPVAQKTSFGVAGLPHRPMYRCLGIAVFNAARCVQTHSRATKSRNEGVSLDSEQRRKDGSSWVTKAAGRQPQCLAQLLAARYRGPSSNTNFSCIAPHFLLGWLPWNSPSLETTETLNGRVSLARISGNQLSFSYQLAGVGVNGVYVYSESDERSKFPVESQSSPRISPPLSSNWSVSILRLKSTVATTVP